MKEEKIKIHTDFPDEIERPFVNAICCGLNVDEVYISRFKRYGRSGARLLLAFFGCSQPEGQPHLIKIGEAQGDQNIHEEYAAFQKHKFKIHDCTLIESNLQPFDQNIGGKELSALLFVHEGAYGPNLAQIPKTLNDVLYVKDSAFSTDKLTAALNTVYDKLEEAHKKHDLITENVNSLYGVYLRERDKAEGNITRVLGHLVDGDEEKDFLEAKIWSPLVVLRKFPNEADFNKGIVHGDLHPDNIVLDPSDKACIVDWAWSLCERDILVDFVLMENSIRFMSFPKFINLDEQRNVDDQLLSYDGWRNIKDLSFSNEEVKRCYIRLSKMVGIIRSRAKKMLGGNFTMERYLLSQFLVLYGLLEFDTYEPHIATRVLGMIARELVKKHPALKK